METYVCQVDVNEGAIQNPQELVSVWGDIRRDIDELGGELQDTYAVLGDYDFLVVFEVPDPATAFQVSQVIERHGLDTATSQSLPLERLGELIDDV